MKIITVTEFARLTTEAVDAPRLDRAFLPVEDFQELCRLNEQRQTGEAPLVRMQSRTTLSLCNYVGLLQTSRGTCIEILPKTTGGAENAERQRGLLLKILQTLNNLPHRESGPAALRTMSTPLQEWLIRHFLEELRALLKKGLCFHYNNTAEEKPFLRGRLDVGKQIVQPPQRRHLLPIRHHVFSVDSPEHRLLRSALDRCISVSRDMENCRRAVPLCAAFAEVRPSRCVQDDFRQWRTSRLLAHYQRIRPLCELILGQDMPLFLAGQRHGISMLFPMETLFERYVGVCLRRQIAPAARLHEQSKGRWLCTWAGRPFLALRPDIHIQHEGKNWLLDCKWKRLGGTDGTHFGISPQDFHQLFAYGQTWLQGRGDLALVYPHHAAFPALDEPFYFSASLRLWVLAFDLHADKLLLPPACPLGGVFGRRDTAEGEVPTRNMPKWDRGSTP